jgi:chromosome segregation ATPase
MNNELEPEKSPESLDKELNEKDIIIADLREELDRIKQDYQLKTREEISSSTNLEKLLQESGDVIANIKADLQSQKTRVESLTTEKQNLEMKIEEITTSLQEKDSMIESYLAQIDKLQQLIQNTEKDILEIEAGHLAIQKQLQMEIKRTEERVGQISDDYDRDTQSTIVRDKNIRTVLKETEMGKIMLFIVDYFENAKKRSLALETLASELNFAPIIARSHLRNLDALGVIKFHEVTKEIKLT